MKIAIIDDDINDRKMLRTQVANWGNSKDININLLSFSNGEEFIKDNIKVDYNIIFIDIFMDRISGIELAKYIRNKNKQTQLVFVTTSEYYRAEAFEVHAFAYIEKPILEDKIFSVLNDAYELFPEKKRHLILTTEGGGMPVLYDEIVFVISDSNYCLIHTEDETYRHRISFKDLQEILSTDERFLRINRGVLINMDMVKKMEKYNCSLIGDRVFPINIRKANLINQEYIDYCFKKRINKISKG